MNNSRVGFYLETMTEIDYDKENNEVLFLRLKSTTDEEDRKVLEATIVENNLGFIHYLIKKRYGNTDYICRTLRIGYDDLFSIACFGLFMAVRTFDVEKGFKFTSYASMVINHEFSTMVRKGKKLFDTYNIESVIVSDKKEVELTLLDTLTADFEGLEMVELNETFPKIIEEVHKQLSPLELKALNLLIGDGTGDIMSMTDVGKNLGVSVGYASKILKRARLKAKKIRTELTEAH